MKNLTMPFNKLMTPLPMARPIFLNKHQLYSYLMFHCVKSVQIRSFFWSLFSYIRIEYGDWSKSPYSVRIQENTDQKKLRIWTLHAVLSLSAVVPRRKTCVNIVIISIRVIDEYRQMKIWDLHLSI